jgi:hypothetical protein
MRAPPPQTDNDGTKTTLEVAMGLPLGERRKLRRMERALARTDPRLDALYSMFTRLSGLEAVPRLERVRAIALRRRARVRRAAPLSSAN